MNDERILVTGGSGFIGSYLVEKLLKEEKRLVIIDKKRPPLKSKNLIFLKGDIAKKKTFQKVGKCGVVFHLAAFTSVPRSAKEPQECFDTNIIGSLNVLEYCRRSDSKLVFTSSAAVYGPLDRPAREEDPCRPISLYGLSKLQAEEIIKFYHKEYDVQYSIFRIFNVYGLRATSGVVTNLLKSFKTGRPFYLYGSGKQKRDFIHVEDVTNIILNHQKIKNDVINLGTGKCVSILDLLKTFQKYRKFKVIRKPKSPGDLNFSCANIKKFRGYFPNYKFKNILEEVSNLITSHI